MKLKVAKKISNNLNRKHNIPFRQIIFFQKILLMASIFLVLGSAFLHLDLVPSVLLGCTIIGFNYFLTKKFVQKILLDQKLQALDIIFLLTKYGISVIVLFGALSVFKLSPDGILIGISNIALATVIFTLFRVLSPEKNF